MNKVIVHLYKPKQLGWDLFVPQTACGLSPLAKTTTKIEKVTCKKCLKKFGTTAKGGSE